MRKTISAAALAAVAVTLAACGGDAGDEQDAPQTEAVPVTETDWFNERFSGAPYFAEAATVNPQIYRPDNNSGEPLPDDAADDETVWQAPACVTVPFTGAGPRESRVDGGVIYLSGYEQSERGAVAAALGLLSTANGARDQDLATAHATGLPLPEAQRLTATSQAFESKPQFVESPAQTCKNLEVRPTAYRVVDFSGTAAVIDLFTPTSNDPGDGVTFRLAVEWKGDDWKLSPVSFDNYADTIEGYDKDSRRTVDLSTFTEW